MGYSSIPRKHPLPLPLGEVAERSEDGEGKQVCKTLSVTCGDSSPRGRAKGLCPDMRNGAYLHRYAPYTVLRPSMKGRVVLTFYALSGNRLSMAQRAASCSALFLLLPMPLPTIVPLRETSTKNCLSWSGPDCPTSS